MILNFKGFVNISKKSLKKIKIRKKVVISGYVNQDKIQIEAMVLKL